MKKLLALSLFLLMGVLCFSIYSFTTLKTVKAIKTVTLKKTVVAAKKLRTYGCTIQINSITTTGSYVTLNYDADPATVASANFGGYWNAAMGNHYSFPTGSASLGFGQTVTVYLPGGYNTIYGGRIGVGATSCVNGDSTDGGHGYLFNLPQATNYGYAYPDNRIF